MAFTLTLDGTWSEYPIEGIEGPELVGLSNGVSSVVVSGVIDPSPDATDRVH